MKCSKQAHFSPFFTSSHVFASRINSLPPLQERLFFNSSSSAWISRLELRLRRGQAAHRETGLQAALPVAGRDRSAEDLVEVEETIPFVPVIAMAVVLTAGFAGNLVPPLVRLIDWLSS